MRGGICSEIFSKLEGNPEGESQGISQGFRLYFTVDPHIIIYPVEEKPLNRTITEADSVV